MGGKAILPCLDNLSYDCRGHSPEEKVLEDKMTRRQGDLPSSHLSKYCPLWMSPDLYGLPHVLGYLA